MRGWHFMPSDPLITERWQHGVIAGGGTARNLVDGSLFTPLGRRAVHVFDHEHGGQVSSVVVAVQRRVRRDDLVVELWLPDRQRRQDPRLTRMGTIGDRLAWVTEPDRARVLMTPEFVFAANSLGADIPVAWLEQDWLLAAAPYSATPTRVERLLRALDEIVDLLDIASAERPADQAETADLADLARWANNEFSPRK